MYVRENVCCQVSLEVVVVVVVVVAEVLIYAIALASFFWNPSSARRCCLGSSTVLLGYCSSFEPLSGDVLVVVVDDVVVVTVVVAVAAVVVYFICSWQNETNENKRGKNDTVTQNRNNGWTRGGMCGNKNKYFLLYFKLYLGTFLSLSHIPLPCVCVWQAVILKSDDLVKIEHIFTQKN